MVTVERMVEIYAIAPVTSYEGLRMEELKEVAKTVGANLKGLRKKMDIIKAIKKHCQANYGYTNKDRDMTVKYLGYKSRGLADLIQVLSFEVTINGETRIDTVDSVGDKSLYSHISDAIISGKSVSEQYYNAIV
jgi:hypothetical protein